MPAGKLTEKSGSGRCNICSILLKKKFIMKTYIKTGALGLCLALIAITSCEKEGVDLYEGFYSYKLSGTLTLDKQLIETAELPDGGTSEPSEPSEPQEVTLPLISESGQMNVLKTSADSLIITMNAIGGDVLVIDALVNGNDLEICEFSRIVRVEDGSRSVSLNCTASGSGKKYDDVLILDFSYSGSGSSTLYDYTVKSSSVKCVAKVNE